MNILTYDATSKVQEQTEVPAFRKDLSSIGTYVPGKPIDEVMREYGVTDIVKLASNECPHEPFAPVQDAIAEAVGDLHRYPDSGAHNLTHALAKHHRVDPTNVWVGPGSSSILTSIGLAMGGVDTNALFSEDSFVLYKIITAYAAARPLSVPLDDALRIDTVALANAVTPETTLVYMCNPNNPTGTYVTPDAIDQLIDSVPSHVLIVIDEAYEEYVTHREHVSALPHALARDNVIVTRTFSKIYGLAGLRVGYAIGQSDTVAALRRLQLPFATTTVSMVAAEEALRHSDLVAERSKENSRGRDQLAAGLDHLGVTNYPSQTNFVLMRPASDASELCQRLMEQGVIVRPMGHQVRVTVGTESENTRFLDTLGELL